MTRIGDSDSGFLVKKMRYVPDKHTALHTASHSRKDYLSPI